MTNLAQEVLYLTEARKSKIETSVRKTLIKILNKISSQTWEKVPVIELLRVLKSHGLVAVQEDGTSWSGLLTGDRGKAVVFLANASSRKGNRYIDIYFEVMSLSWQKLNTKFEVTVYIS